MKFLLDTNVLSETRRRAPEARVVAWLARADPGALFVSVLTLGEIARGIEAVAARDPAAAKALRAWAGDLRALHADRVLGVDADIAETWGRLAARRPLPVVDGLIAATAIVRDLVLVTRNVRDVADTGVRVFNPWEG